MKLKPAITISPGPRGCLKLKFDFRFEQLREQLKEQCLAVWEPREKAWIVGEDFFLKVRELAEAVGLTVQAHSALGTGQSTGEINLPNDMYPFQRAGVSNALMLRSYMLSFDTGLGKSRTALEVIKQIGQGLILIVAPASVQYNWESEINKWGIVADVRILDTGKKIEELFDDGAAGSLILITSWSLLHKLESRLKPNIIIFDELHYAAGRESQRSRAALELRQANPEAVILGLTATPILSEVEDLWHQLHLLYPNRFGSYWNFIKRYCLTEENQWGGLDVLGLRHDTAEELRERVSAISLRVTKEEVKHLLPAFTARPIYVTAEKKVLKELTAEFDGLPEHKQQLDNFVSKAGSLKVLEATEHAVEVHKSGQSKVCILTYFRATADALAEEFQARELKFTHVDGSWSPSERKKQLDIAREQSPFLIATMSSIAEGIDLTAFNHVIFAELYWQPSLMTQVMGRFHRLNGKMPVSNDFLILKGTLDEIIARTLLRRAHDAKQIIAQSTADKALSENLKQPEQSHAEALAELRLAAKSMEQDEYL